MCKLVVKQHLLPSVLWLFEQFVNCGRFSEIDALFKNYSEIKSLEKQLPSSVRICRDTKECFVRNSEEEFLILDEGGGLHRKLPWAISERAAGVEQTSFGLQKNWKYPVILACRSAAKLFFESQVIARGILRKLDSIDLLEGKTIGVVGLGALGSAVARALMSKGIKTLGSENHTTPTDLIDIVVSLPELIYRSDVILGCTGSDILADVDLNGFSGKKFFVSCASSNCEFKSVLKQLSPIVHFDTACGWVGNLNCIIPNGGFPINFDRMREWEFFDEIILTRKLVLESLLQAYSLVGTKPRSVMLGPATQLRIVIEWLERVPDRHLLLVPNSLTKSFFTNNSEGDFLFNNSPKYKLHSTTPSALAKMRSHHLPYETEVMGLPILVLPQVWSPAYDWSSLFYVENMPNVNGLDFLEIGCGTGVISVFAGRGGANRVIAVDVNPEAIRNTQLNFERFDIKNSAAFLSDGFNNVKGKFDVVTWNAPYHGCRPADILERGCADEEYRGIRKFFNQVQGYLKPGGIVVFGFSESGDLPMVESLIADNGFRSKRKLSDWRQDYNCILFELVAEGVALEKEK